LLAPVSLQTVCLRHEPVDADGVIIDGDTLDAHTLSWVDEVNSSGQMLVTPSLLDGRWSVRISVGAEPTERSDVAAAWEAMRAVAESRCSSGVGK